MDDAPGEVLRYPVNLASREKGGLRSGTDGEANRAGSPKRDLGESALCIDRARGKVVQEQS